VFSGGSALCLHGGQHFEGCSEYGLDGQSAEVTSGSLEKAVAWFFGWKCTEAFGAGWSEECKCGSAECSGHVQWSAVIGDNEICASEQFDELWE
jgi:hypothetical protein